LHPEPLFLEILQILHDETGFPRHHGQKPLTAFLRRVVQILSDLHHRSRGHFYPAFIKEDDLHGTIPLRLPLVLEKDGIAGFRRNAPSFPLHEHGAFQDRGLSNGA